MKFILLLFICFTFYLPTSNGALKEFLNNDYYRSNMYMKLSRKVCGIAYAATCGTYNTLGENQPKKTSHKFHTFTLEKDIKIIKMMKIPQTISNAIKCSFTEKTYQPLGLIFNDSNNPTSAIVLFLTGPMAKACYFKINNIEKSLTENDFDVFKLGAKTDPITIKKAKVIKDYIYKHKKKNGKIKIIKSDVLVAFPKGLIPV